MAYDNYEIDFHLTPNGWRTGGVNTTGSPDEIPPEDRVLTIRKSVYQRSGWSSEDIAWNEIWRSPATSEEELAILISKYPSPDQKKFPN
jgi:hypothetical protein